MESTTYLPNVRFQRDRVVTGAPVTLAELADVVARPDFDFVVAVPAADEPGRPGDRFAQVVSLGGSYLFEAHTGSTWSETFLESPSDVVRAFVDWSEALPAEH